MSAPSPTLFVLIGPTAVGKTELSLRLAEFLHCPIVNVDSRQLYRDLPIGTAAPTAAQQARVPHHFVGTLGLTDYYSAAREVPKLAMSERAYMEQLVLPQCRRYLENFDREKGNLLFTGKPGLGKTFLSHCIAGELLKRGHTVLYLSAEELFSLLAATQWRQRAESDEEKIKAREEKEFREYIYGCEFLIIDDLGTEFSNAFTTAAFFSLLNERLLSRLGTLISTNLDPKQLKAQYTERSTSRILGEYDILPFYGSDIRAQKRRQ